MKQKAIGKHKAMGLVAASSIALALGALTLGGCASMGKSKAENPESTKVAKVKKNKSSKDNSAYTTAPEPEGTPISRLFNFGGGAKSSKVTTEAGIGVNAYIWRSSLDALSFMPLVSADPWGGVIITDWYANPEKPDERFKATVFILDSRLRADAVNVNINKQVQLNGSWTDAEVSAQTAIDVENAILTRARQLRLSDVKK
jgi:hypothetical protein